MSRRFRAMTVTALAGLLAKDRSGLGLAAVMIGGMRLADHLCVVDLGFDIDGSKHPVEGAAEITTVVMSLLVGLRAPGLRARGTRLERHCPVPSVFVIAGRR